MYVYACRVPPTGLRRRTSPSPSTAASTASRAQTLISWLVQCVLDAVLIKHAIICQLILHMINSSFSSSHTHNNDNINMFTAASSVSARCCFVGGSDFDWYCCYLCVYALFMCCYYCWLLALCFIIVSSGVGFLERDLLKIRRPAYCQLLWLCVQMCNAKMIGTLRWRLKFLKCAIKFVRRAIELSRSGTRPRPRRAQRRAARAG